MTGPAPTDVVLAVFAAINRGDVPAAVALTAPGVVVDFSRSKSPYRGVYEGREAVGRFWTDWLGTWGRLTWEAEDVEEVVPGRVVLVNHLHGVGRASGVEVDGRGGHVWEVAEGLVTRMALYQSGADARAGVADAPRG